MQQQKRNRLIIILSVLLCFSVGTYLVLSNLRDSIIYFYPPSEIPLLKNQQKFRIGGLVKQGSIKELEEGKIEFTITDNVKEIIVNFNGQIPALFREEQGIIAEGRLVSPEKFAAERLLTKHDENYKPPIK
ncbi:MAG TPA: cytochrome c maturation protein CcmE [Candidatus Megaira endosymbiont of Nemacystus decipiens]|nr:cytochrome c maturation protein CcmE [Candidatus Megaera endosymbiont of Nemacystus decipiens]